MGEIESPTAAKKASRMVHVLEFFAIILLAVLAAYAAS
jgi:hypothetical protein